MKKFACIGAIAALLAGCSPAGLQADYVKLFLNDPDSVQFRDVEQSTREKTAWCGELNARNRMGGMVGFARYIIVLPEDARSTLNHDRETARLLASFHTEGASGFESKWGLWCETGAPRVAFVKPKDRGTGTVADVQTGMSRGQVVVLLGSPDNTSEPSPGTQILGWDSGAMITMKDGKVATVLR